LRNWRDGSLKLYVTKTLMQFRARHPSVFSAGEYAPLSASGAFADNLVAFTRSHDGKSVLVAVPRLTSRLGSPPLGLVWDDTSLPASAGTHGWRDVFTGETFRSDEPLFAHALFAQLPLAVLESVSLTPNPK
jgi:(1->4)-alpha-D-glucan 1-alpha-D-glucosylmutase